MHARNLKKKKYAFSNLFLFSLQWQRIHLRHKSSQSRLHPYETQKPGSPPIKPVFNTKSKGHIDLHVCSLHIFYQLERHMFGSLAEKKIPDIF